MPLTFAQAVRISTERHPRYAAPAYDLVRQGLDHATKLFHPEDVEDRHVTGPQLLEGFRQFMLEEYGPMSLTLLQQVGIHDCLDVGRIVYILIEIGYFGKNPDDNLEDFADIYSLEEAFIHPFLPHKTPSPETNSRMDSASLGLNPN
jgi:uncharacterized repeat protein (TIGR04138 family)